MNSGLLWRTEASDGNIVMHINQDQLSDVSLSAVKSIDRSTVNMVQQQQQQQKKCGFLRFLANLHEAWRDHVPMPPHLNLMVESKYFMPTCMLLSSLSPQCTALPYFRSVLSYSSPDDADAPINL